MNDVVTLLHELTFIMKTVNMFTSDIRCVLEEYARKPPQGFLF